MLYVLKFKKEIIGYAVIAKKTESLISIISKYKIDILYLSIINLKFLTLINLFLIFLKIDTLLLKKETKKIIKQNYNLNLPVVIKFIFIFTLVIINILIFISKKNTLKDYSRKRVFVKKIESIK